MRAWPILFLISLLGCASVPEDEEILPCPDAIAPAEHGPWRLVDAGDFTYCVPMAWDRSGRRAWRWSSGELEWDRRRQGMAFTVQRRSARDLGPVPVSPPRQTREIIGGYVVDLAFWENPGSYGITATWSSPIEIHFHGGGPTPASAELVHIVYRTVRFP